VTPERWGRVSRAFIECLDDHTFPLEVQRRMQLTALCELVIAIESGHSPFLSAPRELADAMITIADQFR
jgi:hypothetical protein